MKIIVSAGPTREKIDPVRFISNRSSGKMGYAIAEVAAELGHEVVLVSGPVALAPPDGVVLIGVESAAEMRREIRAAAESADIIIMAAAVADYRPVEVSERKIKKSDGGLVLELERTEDILAGLGRNKKPGQILVGFAAETDDLIANAKSKLTAKNLDWVIANKVGGEGCPMGADSNQVALIDGKGLRVEIPKAPKKEIARRIIEIIQ